MRAQLCPLACHAPLLVVPCASSSPARHSSLWIPPPQLTVLLLGSAAPPSLRRTIHKVQGASLDWVVAHVAGCFAEGQVYVALSRARSMEGLQVLGLRPSAIKTCAAARAFYAR